MNNCLQEGINIMNNFRYRLAQFMQGRYGADQLFNVIAAVYLAIVIINVFIGSFILNIVGFGLFIFALFRFFSRNTEKRMKENDFVMRKLYGIKGKSARIKERARQNKTHCFKKCPSCGKTLRLPRVKGKHNTRCPSCGCQFSVRIFRDKK